MPQQDSPDFTACNQPPMDWTDIKFGAGFGVAALLVLGVGIAFPSIHVSPVELCIPPFMIVFAYIILRARRNPELLDRWGLTTAVTRPAILTAASLVLFSLACLSGLAIAFTGGIPFATVQLIELGTFLPNVFLQQFFFSSITLTTLSGLHVFRGLWRLPLATALLFGICHMHLPVTIPGIPPIPFQSVLVTMPVGFVFAWYFLKYRSIVLVMSVHIVLNVFVRHWLIAHF